MAFGPTHLVHTDAGALAKSKASALGSGSNELGSRSSAGERLLHTQDVTGSIPVATTTTAPSGLSWAKHWQMILEPYGFNPPGLHCDSHPRSPGDVYFVTLGDMLKVGKSINVPERMKAFRLGCPVGLRLRGRLHVPRPMLRQAELHIHKALAPYARGREWFAIDAREALKIARPIATRARRAVEALDKAGYFYRMSL
jgi:hypothetical protein